MTDEGPIPDALFESPPAPTAAPPVVSASQTLPFGQLTPQNFERLCLRLARLDGSPERCRRYGTPGQAQSGIDIYAKLPSERYATYQCKRYEAFTAGDVEAAVTAFLGGTWAARSDRFALCIATSADRTEIEEAIEEQTTRLAQQQPPIRLEIWDSEELSDLLRGRPDIVGQFFGSAWVTYFCGGAQEAPSQDQMVQAFREVAGELVTPRLVSNDWASRVLRPRLDGLQESNPELFRRLTDQLGSPPTAAALRAAIAAPPAWLQTEPVETWSLMATIGESLGAWQEAADAWEHAARMDGSPTATLLVRAANAQETAENQEAAAALLAEAENLDPTNPRLLISRLDVAASADNQIEQIDAIQSDDPEERGLLAAQRAIAQLLIPDTAGARESFEEARELLPGSLLIDGLDVSVTVQEARLTVLDHRPRDLGALHRAAELAESTRAELLEQRRFSEATRLLMLRADISALREERREASAILRSASAEERASQDQKEVLAEAAMGRAMNAQLALELLADGEDTPLALRIRLEAAEELGTPAEREAALDGLDDIVDRGGPEADVAAFQRLAATLGSKPTQWSETAAAYLRAHGHERAAVSAEALYLIAHSDWAAVEALLRPYGNVEWALAAKLRAASHSSVPKRIRAAVSREVLAFGGDPGLRVEAARALASNQEFSDARATLVAVARDPNAPVSTRAEAYGLLVRIAGREQDDWREAAVFHREWIKLRSTDTAAQAWAPTIANRLRN